MRRWVLSLPVFCMCLLAWGCGVSHQGRRALASAGLQRESVRFLPGGRQRIARGHSSRTAGYAIVAERYRFQHRTYFNLALQVNEIGGGSQVANFKPEPSKRPLAWSTDQGCSPSASWWTILFGVLADPRDRAFAYTPHGRYRLRTATIPPRFRATGVAAYAALPQQPIRILVMSVTGATVMREDLERVPSERCKPGTGIIVLRKRSAG
jgi:hypothetical protein